MKHTWLMLLAIVAAGAQLFAQTPSAAARTNAAGGKGGQALSIRHRFLALDESRKQLLRVDQRRPESDWTLRLPPDATPRDFQLVGDDRVLIASGRGFIECDVKSPAIVRKVDCAGDLVISLRRLASGNLLLLSRDSGMLYEVSPAGAPVRQTKLPFDYARLMRFTPEKNLVVCADSRIVEFDLDGHLLRSVPFRVQDAPSPNQRSGYHVLKLTNGNYLASTCYAASLAEVTPSGDIVRRFGGKDTPQAKAMNWVAFTGFEVLPNGHTVVTTWNGHGAQDSRNGPQLVEFDSDGSIVWQWHDPGRAGSILAVAVFE